MTDTELLLKIINKEIDCVELAKKELKNRGLNENGKWVAYNTCVVNHL